VAKGRCRKTIGRYSPMKKKYYIPTNTSRRMSLSFPNYESLPFVDWNLELSVNNYYAATTVILGGLIHGDSQMREKIISKLHRLPDRPLFREYLLENVLIDIRNDIHIKLSEEYFSAKFFRFIRRSTILCRTDIVSKGI
jgi:hypothetical protein